MSDDRWCIPVGGLVVIDSLNQCDCSFQLQGMFVTLQGVFETVFGSLQI